MFWLFRFRPSPSSLLTQQVEKIAFLASRDSAYLYSMNLSSKYTLLIPLFLLLVFAGCKKDVLPASNVSFDDLQFELIATPLADGDIQFTYIERNISDHRVDYHRNTSCPIQGVGISQDGIAIDGLSPGSVCTSDVPRGFLASDGTFEASANWLDVPNRDALPAGTYTAELELSVGLIHYAETDQETDEWQTVTLSETFTVN